MLEYTDGSYWFLLRMNGQDSEYKATGASLAVS